jgi:anti-sigma regulatory factor (Ser/Thr protein kinase)
MRRHAEGLIILSGAIPGRGWREPVPVVDVLRAAVAEVEDYVRVDVVSESRDLVAGSAVNDVIHLVAELVENATVFSPPNTRIEVRADRVGTGLAAEIEDRGLGLTDTERAEINQRLASAPEFDLANSEQLGLFIVSRLAARHNIKVSLRASVYGGTTAVLLLPFGVVVREEETGPHGDQGAWPVEDGLNRLAARHRLLTAVAGADAGAEEQEWQPAPGTSARALWEPERTAPPAQALPQSFAVSPAADPQRLETTAPWPPAAPASAPWPRPGQPDQWAGPDGGQPLVPAAMPPAGSGPAEPAALSAPRSHLGMPIRVPQSSLAPQLRRHQADPQAAAREVIGRSPEASRDMMIMMRQGWQRGSVDDLDAPAGPPGSERTDSEAGNGTD